MRIHLYGETHTSGWPELLAGVEFINENGGSPDVRLRKDRRNLGDNQYDAPHGRAPRGQGRQPSLT
jgi:hypothetical protein